MMKATVRHGRAGAVRAAFVFGAALAIAAVIGVSGCVSGDGGAQLRDTAAVSDEVTDDKPAATSEAADQGDAGTAASEGGDESADVAKTEAEAADVASDDAETTAEATSMADAGALRAALDMSEDYRESFLHGIKTAEYQKYIVLHDTESEADASSIVDYWDSSGAGVAAHFVVNKDGTIVQCVPIDRIAHHAGFGDTGHNDSYGVVEDGRDDMVGTVPIGSWASDYGMNAWSVGIEMVHVGGSGDYPEAQLDALDDLIAYINASFGHDSAITDHKAWRSGNSDTSEEFATYLANYQDHNTHD